MGSIAPCGSGSGLPWVTVIGLKKHQKQNDGEVKKAMYVNGSGTTVLEVSV